MPPPPGVMSTSSPPVVENPQVKDDEPPPGQRAPSTGTDAREDKFVPSDVTYGEAC